MDFLKKISGSNLFFTVLVVALAAYVYFGEYKKGLEDQKKKEVAEKLVQGFEEDKIEKISLKKKTGESIALEKKNGVWMVSSPVSDRADGNHVQALLGAVFQQKSEGLAAEGEKIDYALYGLDETKGALATIAFSDAAGKSFELKLSSIRAFDGNLYVRISGQNKVLAVSATLEVQFEKDFKEFRMRKFKVDDVLDFDHIQISSRQKDKKFDFALRKVGDVWKVLDPKARQDKGETGIFLTEVPPLNTSVIQLYLEQIKNLRVEDYASENKSDKTKYGFSQPVLTVRLAKGKDEQEFQFAEGGSAGGSRQSVYAISSGTEFVGTVFRATFDNLVKSQSDFYDRKFPFQLKIAEVAGLRIKTAEFRAELKKQGDDWKLISGPKDTKPINSKIVELLERFQKIEALDYLAGPPSKTVNVAKNELVATNGAGQIVWSLSWGDVGQRISSLSSDLPKPKNPDSEVAKQAALSAKESAKERFFYAKSSMVDSTLLIRESNLIGVPWSSIVVASPASQPATSPSTKPSASPHP